jgi:hypothetical protein
MMGQKPMNADVQRNNDGVVPRQPQIWLLADLPGRAELEKARGR